MQCHRSQNTEQNFWYKLPFYYKINTFTAFTVANSNWIDACKTNFKLSLSARSIIENTIRDILPCVNLKVVFRMKNRLSSKSTFKDKISKEMHSLLCYKFQCSSYNATYYGETKHHFKFHVKSTKNSAVCDCMLVCNNIESFEDFSVLANRTNDFRIKLQESFLIHCDGPQLNKKIWVSSFDVIPLRCIIFLASHHCIVLQSRLISDY